MRRILTAAAEEIAAHGLSGAQMIRIAEKAKVSKQLVYHYFSSKEDILTAVLDDLATRTMEEHLRAKYDDMAPEDAVRAFLYRIFDSIERNPLITPLTLSENMNGGIHVSSRSAFRQEGEGIPRGCRFDAVLRRVPHAQRGQLPRGQRDVHLPRHRPDEFVGPQDLARIRREFRSRLSAAVDARRPRASVIGQDLDRR
jgi:AcrR family transcriptional regulator